jgi:hypothetical protein
MSIRTDSLDKAFAARRAQAVKPLNVSIDSINAAVAEALQDVDVNTDAQIANDARHANATLICKYLPQFMEVRRMTPENDADTKAILAEDARRLEARCAELPGRRAKARAQTQSRAEYEQCMLEKFPEMKTLGQAYLAAQKKNDRAAMQRASEQIAALMPKVTATCGPTPGR